MSGQQRAVGIWPHVPSLASLAVADRAVPVKAPSDYAKNIISWAAWLGASAVSCWQAARTALDVLKAGIFISNMCRIFTAVCRQRSAIAAFRGGAVFWTYDRYCSHLRG